MLHGGCILHVHSTCICVIQQLVLRHAVLTCHVCVCDDVFQHVMDMGDEHRDQGTVPDMGPPVTHAHDVVNISEEVSKTGIWHHLNSQPVLAAPSTEPSYPRHRFASCISHAVL